MSTAPLDLKIAVIGANKLDKLVKRMDVLEGEVARLNKTLPKASNNIKKVGTASAGAATQTSKFSKAVGGLAAAFASIQIGAGFAEAVKDARALELSGRRLKLLTSEYSQFNGVQKEAERLAVKFQVSIADSSKALFSLGSRLGSQGTTLEEIVSVYEGLNSALIVTGRSAQEAASANYQLSQALGSGKLTGDELRTIVETLPELLNEIAKQAGKTSKEIRQMAKDGELTTDVIIKATKALGEKYADAVKDSITVNQKFQNSIQGVSEKIGKSLLPVVNPLQEKLIEILSVVIQLPDPIIAVGTAAVAAAVGIGALQAALSLLGLPGVISLFGKLAIALAGVYGATTTAVTGFTAAGAAIKATTLVVTAQTVALGALKLAFLAIPYAAIAAGLFVIVKAFTDGINKAKEWAKILRDSGAKEFQSQIVSLNNEKKKLLTTLQKLKDSPYYRGMKGDIAEIEKQVKELDIKIDEATRRRKLIVEIETILGRKGVDVQSLRDGFYGPGGSAGAVDVETPETPTGGDDGGAPRASDAPQLRRDLKLAQDLFALNSELIDAELNRNKLRIEGIEITKIGLETAKEIADVKASDLYDDEKALAIEKLKVAEAEKLLAIQKDGAIAARDKEETEAQGRADALRPLQEQRRILDAILLGRGEEERLLIDIENIMSSTVGLEKSMVEELVRGNAAREKEAEQLQEIEAFYSAISQTIQDGIVDGIMAAVDGSKELSEVLSGVLRSLGQMFLKQAVGSVFSGLGFADGGRPPMNQASVVGERGPELFVPDTAGTIIPNDAFDAARGAMGNSGGGLDIDSDVIGSGGGGGLDADSDAVLGGISNYYNQNGGASSSNSYTQAGGMGSSSERAFTQNSNSISNTNSLMRDRAIQREEKAIYDRAVEQNNQTTMGGSGSMVIQTQVINNVEYATVDQVAAASAASAKQARAQVFSDLKNKPSRRAAIGMR